VLSSGEERAASITVSAHGIYGNAKYVKKNNDHDNNFKSQSSNMMVYELLPLSMEQTDRDDESPYNFGMDMADETGSPIDVFSGAFKSSSKKIMHSVASTKHSTHNTAYGKN